MGHAAVTLGVRIMHLTPLPFLPYLSYVIDLFIIVIIQLFSPLYPVAISHTCLMPESDF